jgi:hypothetical protein
MTEGREDQAEYDRLMEAAGAAKAQGDLSECLAKSSAAFEALPGKYPENYRALLMAYECLKSLRMEEEAKEVKKTLSKIVMEYDTKKRAEAEARGRHPLTPDKRKEM